VYLNHIQQTSIVHKSHYKKASYTHYWNPTFRIDEYSYLPW
jgi:hypothetical protein